MCRADVPVARRFRDGMAQRDSNEWPVVRVSTQVDVGRSQVFNLWSCEAECATVASPGLKITLETGEVWPESVDNAPRAGTMRSGFDSFWRLFDDTFELESSSDGADGFSFALLENNETVVSEDAARILLEDPCTAMSSTPQ